MGNRCVCVRQTLRVGDGGWKYLLWFLSWVKGKVASFYQNRGVSFVQLNVALSGIKLKEICLRILLNLYDHCTQRGHWHGVGCNADKCTKCKMQLQNNPASHFYYGSHLLLLGNYSQFKNIVNKCLAEDLLSKLDSGIKFVFSHHIIHMPYCIFHSSDCLRVGAEVVGWILLQKKLGRMLVYGQDKVVDKLFCPVIFPKCDLMSSNLL